MKSRTQENKQGDKMKTTALTRKHRRKEERKIKKMQKSIFCQHKQVPSIEALREKKAEEKKAVERLEAKKKKKRLQRKKRYEAKREEREEQEKIKEEAREATQKDTSEIKKCEKMLFLNKRKSKSLPQSFRDEGLDYILEAVDPECLQVMYETGGEQGGTTILEDVTAPTIQDEEDSSDMEFGEEDESDNNDDDDDDDDDEKPEEVHCMTKSDAKQQKETLINDIMNQLKSTAEPPAKKVKFMDEVMQEVKAGKDDDDDDEDSEEEGQEDSDGDDSDESEGMEDEEENQCITEDFEDIEEEMDEDEDEDLDEEEEDNDDDQEMEDEGTDDDDESDDADSDKESKDSDLAPPQDTAPKKEDVKEDIYGRLRDRSGNVVSGGYVPPAQRLAMAKTEDGKRQIQLERMKKQLKGIFNRLSESNLQPLSSQLAEIFSSHSRAETTEAVTEVILAACVAPHSISERLITEHVMMLAILNANIGTEVGAMFLQSVVQKFEALCAAYDDSKEMDNLLVLLAMLYNFKVVGSELIFDILKKFADRFKEKDVELLLLLLRHVGFGLRKDDPAALKELIVDIQNRAAAMDTTQTQDQSRVRFMLETIGHIRNNNVRKIPNYDPSHMEHLRKLLRNYATGSSTELHVSLADMLSAEQRGKWWLVGSAWQGRTLQPATMGGNDPLSSAASSNTSSDVPTVSANIMELARKQRMNTDIRRNIFSVVMTSEDFVDAFNKLLRLGLTKQAEQEIVHVIIDVCLQEKTYNAFYAYLMQKFCEYDRRFQMTLQFNLWDKFKLLTSWKQKKVQKLSQLLSHLIATKAMSLSVFKVIETADYVRGRVSMMREVLLALLRDYDEHITMETFGRVSGLDRLEGFRDGLKVFMRHFILKPFRQQHGGGGEAVQQLQQRIELAEKALSAHSTNHL